MNNLRPYKIMPEWDCKSLPKLFRNRHNTKIGTWAQLKVFSGQLKYYSLDKNNRVLDTLVIDQSTHMSFIKPQAWHKIEPLTDDLRCQLTFYCHPDVYYQKKYGLSATHSEVIALTEHIQSGKALDLGCGGGRNALYLQRLGFDVTAFDFNAGAIDSLKQIINTENLDNITAYVNDAHNADISDDYNLIMSLVVFMFLQEQKIPEIIKNIQSHTKKGGYNLIVCAMDSDDYPMSDYHLPFNFGFKTGALKKYYNQWNIVKYNENRGHLHRKDANGNQIALRFATLIAQKP